jgi:hypothetical protein
MTKTIGLSLGGFVIVANGLLTIDVEVRSPLATASSPASLTRDEAEQVVKALTAALAKLRGAEAQPEKAETIERKKARA